MNISELRKRHNQEVVLKDTILQRIDKTEKDMIKEGILLENYQKARIIIQTVAEQTQSKIEFHISNLVSMALEAVFPDPYEFLLRFVQRRNKTEADLLFIKRGNEGDPMDVSGGGALDIASFALRVATWSIKPSAPVIILDEPFHFLSRDLQEKCSKMIKIINEKIDLQFIIVSHVPEITEAADRVFNVTNNKGVSVIQMEDKNV